MTVYIEYAFAENFLLDGLFLYLALKCMRTKVRLWRLLLAAAVGGGEALLFPILELPNRCAYLIKFLGGSILPIITVSKERLKTYVMVTAAFFIMTFLLGGLLTGIYSFLDISYVEGQGYYLESAPVALVVSVAGIFAILILRAAKYLYRYQKVKRNIFSCSLTVGEKTVIWQGFADSGNCLSYQGIPVCVVSAFGALALFRSVKPVGRMIVSTVNGSRDSPVFACEKFEIEGCLMQKCYFTVGEISSKEYQIILHTALVEGAHERTDRIKGMAKEIRGE